MERNIYKIGKELFITSDKEIKMGDWVHCKDDNTVIQLKTNLSVMLANSQKEKYGFKTFYKIILTTDADLIKNGVQAIDDEFLEWFVKNPSCEFVEVIQDRMAPMYHDIIIPKEEPKKIFDLPIATNLGNALTASAKWQSERMYSDEEVWNIIRMVSGMKESGKSDIEISEYFEQFKKK